MTRDGEISAKMLLISKVAYFLWVLWFVNKFEYLNFSKENLDKQKIFCKYLLIFTRF